MVLEEQKDLFVKNLIYLVNELVTTTDLNIKKEFSAQKLFGKVSYIGRKLMLDIRTAVDRLEAILCFFSLSLDLFAQIDQDPDAEENLFRLTCTPILQLT